MSRKDAARTATPASASKARSSMAAEVALPPGVSDALRNWDNEAFAAALGASLRSDYTWGVPQAQAVLERIVATWATARDTLKCGKCARGCGNTAPDALTGNCGRWINLSEAFMGIVPPDAWMPLFAHRSPMSFGMAPKAASLIVHAQHIIILLQIGSMLADVYRRAPGDDNPFTPFIRMCRVGATAVVRYMAERRPGIVNEKQPGFDQPPLIAALLEGHVDTANALLDLGADPKVPMRVPGLTTTYPTAAAVFVDRECAILPRLLDMHPEMLDWKNEALVTRLRDAVCHRNIKAIAELLRRGARTDDVSLSQRTLLMEPFYNQDLAVATALLEGGAAAGGKIPRDACIGSLLTAAQVAVDCPVPCGVCRACLGVSPDSRAPAHIKLRIDCRDAFAIFELALKHLAAGAAHMLLPKNSGDLAECAYLPAAVVDGKPTAEDEGRIIRALKLLRDHGFDIAGPGRGGMTTPLHMAANRDLTRVIKFLVTEAGANPDCTSGSCQMTPLSVALIERQLGAAGTLLDLGAVPHAPFTQAVSAEQRYMQASALHVAARLAGGAPILKRMLAADPLALTRLDSDGGNVFHHAVFEPMTNLGVLLACGLPGLEEAINRVRDKHAKRDTPLHVCLQGSGDPADAVRLIKAGARVDIPDAHGETAADLACYHGRYVQAAVAWAQRGDRSEGSAAGDAAGGVGAAPTGGGDAAAAVACDDEGVPFSALAGGAGKKAAKPRKKAGQKLKKGGCRKPAAKPGVLASGAVGGAGAGTAPAGHCAGSAAAGGGDEGSDDDGAGAEEEDVLDGSLVD